MIAPIVSGEQPRRALPIALVAFACAVSYCGGNAHGRDQVTASMRDSVRRALIQELAQVARRTTADSVASVVSATRSDVARKVYAAVRRSVEVISDTVLRVDTLVVRVPPPIAAVIRSSEERLRLDSIAYASLTQYAADLAHERDLWKRRAENAEAALREQKRPRFGLRSGALLGAIGAGLLIHLVR